AWKRREILLRVATDEAHRIDLAAVLEHFEVHVRTGGTTRGPHVRERVAARHGLAHAHGETGVVAVTGHEAIAVADLHEIAVPRLFSGIGDYAGCDGHDVGTLWTREIDALVDRLVAGERVLALAEVRGDMPFAHRTAVGADLLVELFREQRVFQRGELCVARGDLLLEAIEHGIEVWRLDGRADVGFGTAHGGLTFEVELTLVDVGHLR